MIRTHRALLLLLLPTLLLAPALRAEARDVPTAPARTVKPPLLARGTADLLPFDDIQRQAFNKKHGILVYRIQALERQAGKLAGKAARIKNPRDATRRKLVEEARRLRIQTTALRMRLTQELVAFGVDGALIAYMNAAPQGPGRLERYAHGLVLLLDDLTPTQRALLGLVVPQIDGAYDAIAAQKERTLLALKQSSLPKDQVRSLSRTFDRQLRLIDQRFWLLVDCTLDRDQKVAIWKNLPQRVKHKSQPVELLYQLPGLTPSQALRLKANLTEMEHEAAPDQAAVKRIGAKLRAKGLSPKERQALTRERGKVYGRLGALRRDTYEATRAILTHDQWLTYEAIPPRLSTNDRSGNFNRVFSGFKPSPAQAARMKAMQAALRKERRAMLKRLGEIRREGADYGPDSPQMMSMQMEMAGARAESAAMGRKFLGGMFTKILTPAEVTHWVMGHWGYKR